MSFRTLTALFLLLAFAAGCSELVRNQPWQGTLPKTEAELELCQFDKVYEPTMLVRHHDPQGRLFFGDVLNFQGFADRGETEIRSAEARPKEPFYIQKVKTDCKNETTGRYYRCTVKVKVDMSEVGAVVRSNYSDPMPMAIRLCSDAAREAWREQMGFDEDNPSQKCVAEARAICPFPQLPDPEAKTE